MKRDTVLAIPPLVEHITHDGQTIAVIVRREYRTDGIESFTPSTFSQQLGYMNRPAGHVVAPRVRRPVLREVSYTNEVLFIRRGRLRVDFYTAGARYIESTMLMRGDIILLVEGGHGFEMLEPTEIIEVKQGPDLGDTDKVRFDPVPSGRIQMRNTAFRP